MRINSIISLLVVEDLTFMAEVTRQGHMYSDNTVTSSGVHCLRPDCVLPTCINAKVGKIKKNTDSSAAKKSRKSRALVNTAEGGIGSSVTKEQDAELFWGDLESILKQNVSVNTHNGSLYQDIAAIPDGTADPHEQGSVSEPSFGQLRIQVVRNQPQLWMQERNPRFSVVSNPSSVVDNTKISRQFLSVNQPIVTEQTDWSPFSANNHVITPPSYSHSAPSLQYDVTYRNPGIGKSSLAGLNGPQVHSTIEQFENTPDISINPRRRIYPMGKVFGILSLILQAFDSPHTAQLEECYTSALQKALSEIQAAKSVCE